MVERQCQVRDNRQGIAIATANKTGNRMARKSRSEKWYNKNH